MDSNEFVACYQCGKWNKWYISAYKSNLPFFSTLCINECQVENTTCVIDKTFMFRPFNQTSTWLTLTSLWASSDRTKALLHCSRSSRSCVWSYRRLPWFEQQQITNEAKTNQLGRLVQVRTKSAKAAYVHSHSFISSVPTHISSQKSKTQRRRRKTNRANRTKARHFSHPWCY